MKMPRLTACGWLQENHQASRRMSGALVAVHALLAAAAAQTQRLHAGVPEGNENQPPLRELQVAPHTSSSAAHLLARAARCYTALRYCPAAEPATSLQLLCGQPGAFACLPHHPDD